MHTTVCNEPTTCENLALDRGAGFILARLSNGPMTRKEVYDGTKYGYAVHNGKLDAGYHSLLWAWLRHKGYIQVESGRVYDTYRPAFADRRTPCTAVRGLNGRAPAYAITDDGRDLLLSIAFRTATRA